MASNTTKAVLGLLEKCELGPYDLDDMDYEDDDEILAQMNAAKAELEGVSEVSREMVNKIFQDPLIQRHFLRRIAEAVDFITSSDFQSDDESAFKY